MNRERYARVRELFLAAREQPEVERAKFVAQACGGDDELRAAVLELVEHAERESHFLESAAVLDVGDELFPGDALGNYVIERKLGEGGFGDVYAAEQRAPLRRRVALKVLKRGLDSRALLARFQGESQALARMDHPHVAKVVDAGVAPSGQPYFAMELVDGEPITRFCERHGLGLRARIALLRAVCGAVQHAHQKGLIHRDLKPSNVLVAGAGDDPQPKVIDFGVAKAIAGDLGHASLATEPGAWIGTPAYMAPEQAGADARDIDTRSDVYALGAIAYELFTGAPPFDVERLRRASLAEVARTLRDEEPPRPSARAAQVAAPPVVARALRGELDWIVMKALEKDRERRYVSPAELAADLARFLEHDVVLAGPPSTAYRIAKFARRNRLAVAAAAVLALALTGGAAATLWQARIARAERDRSLEAEQRADAQRTQAETKAESVLAVLEFVNRTLAGARPENARQGERTVREMLDDGARAADASFAGRPPEVEAQVRLLLGNAYRSLSLYDDARPQLERALERFRAAQGAGGPEALRALNDLAALDGEQGRYDEALARYRESVEQCTRSLGAEHLRTLTARLNLAQVLRQLGDFEGAQSTLQELCDAAPGDDATRRRLHLFACQSLASNCAQMGDPARALVGLERVLADQRELLGADHPEVLDTASNYGSVLVEVGRVDDGERVFRETLETQRRVLGPDHVATAASEVNLAGVCSSRGQFAEAVALYEHALATRRARLGADHPDTQVAEQRLELARSELADMSAAARAEQ